MALRPGMTSFRRGSIPVILLSPKAFLSCSFFAYEIGRYKCVVALPARDTISLTTISTDLVYLRLYRLPPAVVSALKGLSFPLMFRRLNFRQSQID